MDHQPNSLGPSVAEIPEKGQAQRAGHVPGRREITRLDEIKRDVNLIDYIRQRTSQPAGGGDMLLCPFHEEKTPSFHVFKGRDSIWHYQDFHDQAKGTIVDLVVKLDGLDDNAACKKLLEEFPGQRPAAKAPEIEREHIYRDRDGAGVHKKVKHGPGSWKILHAEKEGWLPGKGDREFIPYNLDKFKNHTEIVVCEGEKDADLVTSLGVLATSAPTGKGNWPDEITPHFKQFKRVVFLYDVGNDEYVKKHAAKLHAAFPETEIAIAKLPSEKTEFDISDYLCQSTLELPANKKKALELIIQESKVLHGKPAPEAQEETKERAKPAPDMPELSNSFLNRYVSHLSKITDASPVFLLFSGIALLSGILNKFYFMYPRRTNLNLYILLLAPSTYYRKSTTTDVVADYINAVNPSLMLPESFTPEALYEILKKYPRGLIIWRELIQVKEFQLGAEYNKGLASFLVDVYDYKKEHKRWTVHTGEIIVENPIVSILSAGIASWFVQSLQQKDFQGGIWTRFLFVPAPEQEREFALPKPFVTIPAIEDQLKELDLRVEAEMDIRPILPAMVEWGREHMKQTIRIEGDLQAVFQRLEAMLLKLACLFQLATDGSTTVTETAFQDAVTVIEYIKAKLPVFFRDEIQFDEFNKGKAAVTKALREKADWLGKAELLRITRIKVKLMADILSQLTEEDLLETKAGESGPEGGRRSALYRLIRKAAR